MSRVRLSIGLLFRICCPRFDSTRSTAAVCRRLCSTSKNCSSSQNANSSGTGNISDVIEKDFKPKKALLVRKVTRYEYEKVYLKPELNEAELKDYIIAKGSDYEALCQRHTEYFNSLKDILKTLSKKGIEYRIVHRYEFDKSLIDWADVIFTAGGDGTFLMVASNMKGHSKPIVGINTDPLRSEGFLCLSKHYSKDFERAIDQVINGNFRWLLRQRIRMTMYGKETSVVPADLHNQQMLFPEHRFWEHVRESEQSNVSIATVDYPQPATVLPVLALNEVFIGESLSARVSFYEVLIDDGVWQKQKSSGITACPGTGSTSWYFNINHITQMTVRDILHIAQKYRGCNNVDLSSTTMQKIVHEFNTSLVFSPSDRKMAYTHRDPVSSGIFQVAQPRGFCQSYAVRHRVRGNFHRAYIGSASNPECGTPVLL